MIVVVGSPIARSTERGTVAAGLSAAIARDASAIGGAVQLVGRVGEDPAGEAILLGLAAAGVGHVAVLREPGRPTPILPSATTAGIESDDGAIDVAGEPFDGPDAGDAGDPIDGLSLDSADLELALRYLPDYRVVVVAADLDERARATVVAAAGWAGAQLVVLTRDAAGGVGLPDDATILERPATDPEGAFAAMVAAYAVGLDRGAEPGAAFAEASGARGWAPVAD